MAKKQKEINQAVAAILASGQSAQAAGYRAKKPSPLGVPLDQAEIDQLTDIAAELGVKRHHVLQYAVRQFLADWAAGKRPKVIAKTINTLWPQD